MRQRKIISDVFFWTGVYALYILVFRTYSLSLTKTMTVGFCYLIFITADYYLINHLIIPRLLLKKNYFLFAVSTATVIAFSAWLRALLAVPVQRYFFHANLSGSFADLYFNSVLTIAVWVLLITAAKMLIARIQTHQQLEWLEKERIKTELDYLKAQINPHALFNSLNTIYGSIDKSNAKARDILLQFSELLRYQLYDCGAERVCLEKEIGYLQNYIAFQRLRKDDHLKVCTCFTGVEEGLLIAPLLFVVLVENAFKFVSTSFERENKIVIKMITENGLLHCRVFNTKDKAMATLPASSTGIGLLNLKRRLELLYPGKHNLLFKNEDNLYEANLSINLS